MAQWRFDKERGEDVAMFRLEAQLNRAEDAILQAWRRDNRDPKTGRKPTVKQALAVVLLVGFQEMGRTYDPTRKK